MATNGNQNSVSIDFLSAFLDSIGVLSVPATVHAKFLSKLLLVTNPKVRFSLVEAQYIIFIHKADSQAGSDMSQINLAVKLLTFPERQFTETLSQLTGLTLPLAIVAVCY